MIRYTILFLFALLMVSCSTDFSKVQIDSQNLNGFIEGGDASGVYGKAGLKITGDSIKMQDWPMSRLVRSLNKLRDTTLEDQTSAMQVYNIQIANTGDLDEGAFCDSLIVTLGKYGLVK